MATWILDGSRYQAHWQHIGHKQLHNQKNRSNLTHWRFTSLGRKMCHEPIYSGSSRSWSCKTTWTLSSNHVSRSEKGGWFHQWATISFLKKTRHSLGFGSILRHFWRWSQNQNFLGRFFSAVSVFTSSRKFLLGWASPKWPNPYSHTSCPATNPYERLGSVNIFQGFVFAKHSAVGEELSHLP